MNPPSLIHLCKYHLYLLSSSILSSRIVPKSREVWSTTLLYSFTFPLQEQQMFGHTQVVSPKQHPSHWNSPNIQIENLFWSHSSLRPKILLCWKIFSLGWKKYLLMRREKYIKVRKQRSIDSPKRKNKWKQPMLCFNRAFYALRRSTRDHHMKNPFAETHKEDKNNPLPKKKWWK